MNRLIALLLAFLMPFCALAETYGVSISIDTDEQMFASQVKELLRNLPEASDDPQLDIYIKLAQRLLDGLGLNIALQDDALSVDIQLGSGSLLDMTFYDQGANMAITSSLLEGYALEDSIEQSPGATNERYMQHPIDWALVEVGISNAIKQWLSNLQPVTISGAYVGDAFENGGQCTTWAFNDKDVTALVENVVAGETRAAAAVILSELGLDAEELLDSLQNANARVAEENSYRYLLRVVSNEQGERNGLALTVYREARQIATISLGKQGREYHLVFGFSVQDKNYWCELTASLSSLNNMTYLSGNCIEWLAEKNMSFAYAKAATAPVSNQAWYCNIAESGKRYLWDAGVYEGDKTNYAYYYSSSGTVTPSDGVLDCSFSLGASPYIPLTIKLKCGPVAEISALNDALVHCSMTDPADAVLYQELMDEMRTRLTARLLKLIPLDLLLQLNNLELP